jgi:preprotein translocase subunit SecY
MLITVGVILDTMRQIETFLLQRHYDGFLRRAASAPGAPTPRPAPWGDALASRRSASSGSLVGFMFLFGIVAWAVRRTF